MGRSGGGGGHSGGGGFSGGGFSGGGRSSGGFSGGSHSGRSGGGSSGGFGGFGGSGHRPPSGGGFHSGPIFINNSRNYGGGNSSNGGNSNQGKSTGCITVVVLFLVVLLLFALIGTVMFGGSSVTKSTVERQKLPASAVTETAYYEDTAGWISNANELTAGLKTFYQETGIQPYLYIAEGYDQPTSDQLSQQASLLYEQLFTDEGHFLLIFYDNTDQGNYTCGYTIGSQAKAVMDNEAISMLADYLDYYYPTDLSEEEFFSNAFADTAHRMMTVTKSPVVPLAGCATVIIVLVLVIFWWKKAKEKKAEELRKTEEILRTPLEKFGDSDLEDLEKKYQDKKDKNNE